MAHTVKSASTSPVLTAVDSPHTEASSAHVTHETLDKALVSQWDLEEHAGSRERFSPPGTPYSTTSTLTSLMLPALEPSGEEPARPHTGPLTEQHVKDIVNEEMLVVAKEFGNKLQRVTNEFSDWAKNFGDEMTDQIRGGYQKLSAQVRETTRNVEETNRYVEESQRNFAKGMAEIEALLAQQKADREARQRKRDLNRKS
jgi:hypothetical protein